jgi:hypothetical protein
MVMVMKRLVRHRLARPALYGGAVLVIALMIQWAARRKEMREDVSGFLSSTFRVAGTAQGGTVTVGRVGNPEEPVTVGTVAGETAAQVMVKLVAAINASPAFYTAKMSPDGRAIRLYNNPTVFMRTTDNGIQQVPTITNLTALPVKQGRVTLSWTVPSPAPDRIAIFRNKTAVASLSGTTSSYVDEVFDRTRPVGWKIYYCLLCVDTEAGMAPIYSDIVTADTGDPETVRDDIFRIANGEFMPDLPGGVKNAQYSAGLYVNRGRSPISWSLVNGVLPDGLSLAGDGSISGTPTVVGTSSFTVKAADAAGATTTRELSISVADAGR